MAKRYTMSNWRSSTSPCLACLAEKPQQTPRRMFARPTKAKRSEVASLKLSARQRAASGRPHRPRSVMNSRRAMQNVSDPLIRHHRANDSVFLYAFDLVELMVTTCGVIRFRSARRGSFPWWPSLPRHSIQRGYRRRRPDPSSPCGKFGLEGNCIERRDSTYRSGRSPHWLKMKNPACAAVKREAEGIGEVTDSRPMLWKSFFSRDVGPIHLAPLLGLNCQPRHVRAMSSRCLHSHVGARSAICWHSAARFYIRRVNMRRPHLEPRIYFSS